MKVTPLNNTSTTMIVAESGEPEFAHNGHPSRVWDRTCAACHIDSLRARNEEMAGLLNDARQYVCVAWNRLSIDGGEYATAAKAVIDRIDALKERTK